MALRRIIPLGAALACAVGCAVSPSPAGPAAGSAARTDSPRRLAVADRLRFDSPGVPELHGREVAVREDGRIELPLIGATPAAGHTSAELEAALERRFSRFYIEPQIRVGLFMDSSHRWFIMSGETVRKGRLSDGSSIEAREDKP